MSNNHKLPERDPNYQVAGLSAAIKGKITEFACACMDLAWIGAKVDAEERDEIRHNFHRTRYNLERTIKGRLDAGSGQSYHAMRMEALRQPGTKVAVTVFDSRRSMQAKLEVVTMYLDGSYAPKLFWTLDGDQIPARGAELILDGANVEVPL